VKPYNHSLEALLKSCRLVGLEKDTLLVEAFYPFHKEKLESASCQNILRKVLLEEFGITNSISFTLGTAISQEMAASKKSKKVKARNKSDDEEDDLVHPLQGGVDDAAEAADVFSGDL